MENYSDQEIMRSLDQAPQLVQDRITNANTAREIAAMGKVRGLHIDQIGKIAELNRNALLGLITPQEFLEELIVVGVADKDAREIMTEINQKIFVPLRKEEESASEVRPPPEIPKVEPQMQGASRMLEDHEEPHIEFPATPPARSAVMRPAPTRVPTPQPRPNTIITAYTSDPYREPVDEEK